MLPTTALLAPMPDGVPQRGNETATDPAEAPNDRRSQGAESDAFAAMVALAQPTAQRPGQSGSVSPAFDWLQGCGRKCSGVRRSGRAASGRARWHPGARSCRPAGPCAACGRTGTGGGRSRCTRPRPRGSSASHRTDGRPLDSSLADRVGACAGCAVAADRFGRSDGGGRLRHSGARALAKEQPPSGYRSKARRTYPRAKARRRQRRSVWPPLISRLRLPPRRSPRTGQRRKSSRPAR